MKRLHPRAVWLYFFSSFFAWLLLLFPIGVFSGLFLLGFLFDQPGEAYAPEIEFSFGAILLWILVFLTAEGIFSYLWARLTYHFYRYELREDGFRKELGVIHKKYVTIPYERIQNVDIDRGILDRLLGLSRLSIQTAGASATFSRYGAMGVGAEGSLPGLSREVAEQLRDELVKRARQPNSQGL